MIIALFCLAMVLGLSSLVYGISTEHNWAIVTGLGLLVASLITTLAIVIGSR